MTEFTETRIAFGVLIVFVPGNYRHYYDSQNQDNYYRFGCLYEPDDEINNVTKYFFQRDCPDREILQYCQINVISPSGLALELGNTVC